MNRIVTLFLCLSVAALAGGARVRKRPPQPKESTVAIIERVNDYWQQHHKPQVRSFWDEAAYHTGNMEAYRLLGHARWLDYSSQWACHNQWSGAREKDASKWKYKRYGEGQDYVLFGDWQICFQTYLDLYALNPHPYKIARALEVMDYEVRQPQNDFWWWADALYMVMPVFTKLYKATGEVKYLDKLYRNFCYADSLMFDQEAGLYYRDGRYVYPAHKTDIGKKDFWARGDGWVLAGLAKVLTDMPADYRHRSFFEQRFRQLAAAVSQCQQPEGYWSRSMLDPEQAEGPETSGTAFFTFGLLWGLDNGLLPREPYEAVVQKAWHFLTQKALQPSGAVGYVQPIGDRAVKGQQLTERNEANFGVGAFLLAACEMLRHESMPSEGSTAVAPASGLTVTVKNPTADYRNEVVAIPADTVFRRLGLAGGRQFVVCDAAGLEVPCQLAHNGLVLFEASVRPGSSARFTIRRGVPQVWPNVCYGRQYPERKDDLAWENDRGAWRIYGPALQATGERSYGIDVWTKNTPDLVVEQRYWTEDVVWMPVVERLRKENRHRGDSLYRTISYHYDHGRGLDPYKVGATLGCGAPALRHAGTIHYPYCYKTFELLDNGPLRFSVKLTYGPTVVAGDTVVEHRVITLDKGSNFNRIEVWYEGLRQPVDFVSGVVLHDDSPQSVVLSDRYVACADPTDNAAVINAPLFVGAFFPDGQVATRREAGHALGILSGYRGQRYAYYAGSAWSKYDVRSLQEWQQRVEWHLRAVNNPLKVEVR